MPIDPSIPLKVQMPDFAGIYGNTMQNYAKNALVTRELQAADAAQAEKNRLAMAYKSAFDPQTGQINRNKLFESVANAGRGDLLPELQKTFADQDKVQADANIKKLEFDISNTRNAREEIARAMGKNDAVEVARRFVARGVLDPDTANSIVQSIPDDPKGFSQWQNNFSTQLLDAEKRMDALYKQEQLAIQRGQLGVSQGNLAVNQANLGIARGRLALDTFKATQPVRPTAAEAQKREKTQKGQGNVSSLVGKLRGYYSELEQRGGAVREGGGLANVPSYLAGTIGFKEIPQALGTQASSTRDKIKSARRALVQEIKNATGMSAQEMNSNAELQGLLDSATDPTQPLEAVFETLNTLESLYGRQGAATPAPSTNIDALLEKYR